MSMVFAWAQIGSAEKWIKLVSFSSQGYWDRIFISTTTGSKMVMIKTYIRLVLAQQPEWTWLHAAQNIEAVLHFQKFSNSQSKIQIFPRHPFDQSTQFLLMCQYIFGAVVFGHLKTILKIRDFVSANNRAIPISPRAKCPIFDTISIFTGKIVFSGYDWESIDLAKILVHYSDRF